MVCVGLVQVLDSPFSKLTDLMLELVEEQRLPIPRALYKMALGMMRRSVKKRAHFNIDTVSPIDVVQESYIPALFGTCQESVLETWTCPKWIMMHNYLGHSEICFGTVPVRLAMCLFTTACSA